MSGRSRLWSARICALVTAGLIASGCSSLATPQTASLSLSSSATDHARLLVVTVRNPLPPNIPHAGSTTRSYDAPAQYAASPAAEAQAAAIGKAYGLKRAAAWPIAVLGVHCVVFEAPEGADRAQLLARLRRDPRVESAQPMQSFNTLSAEEDHDPYRKLQRNLDEMNVSAAHRYSRGEGVRVAVIDTGVDVTHPDLKGRIAEQQNFVDARSAQSLPERHGTAVAGIIAANENNREGIVGIAPGATLFAYRACWPTQDASASATCNTLTLAKALSAAIDRKMNIVNLSLSGPSDPLLERIVAVGIRRGTLFVGAAPPRASGTDQLFPTSIAGVISVDRTAHPGGADAELFAPGDEVLTLVPSAAYDFMSGSSLSAASVSGGLALLLARDRHLTSASALDLLTKSSHAHGEAQASTVDLCAAMSLLLNESGCTR